jgi:hypothetical protein
MTSPRGRSSVQDWMRRESAQALPYRFANSSSSSASRSGVQGSSRTRSHDSSESERGCSRRVSRVKRLKISVSSCGPETYWTTSRPWTTFPMIA